MRLLDTRTKVLKEFYDSYVPLYAILSHTWEDGEILFADITSGSPRDTKAGWTKVDKACEIALQDGWEWIWIDTCCIDKTSSAELSEAINSMFQWYAAAAICYAYLADISISKLKPFHDVSAMQPNLDGYESPKGISLEDSDVPAPAPKAQGLIHDHLFQSKWFTRGWTLQELLAPKFLLFIDHDWLEIGTKSGLADEIEFATGISKDDAMNFKDCSVARRLSWAAKRQTTRIEDEAYCLLGLFGIHMPLLYGEKSNAFRRLQIEIISTLQDHSVLAWNGLAETILAPSPSYFRDSGNVQSRLPSTSTFSPEFTMTSGRLTMEVNVWIQDDDPRAKCVAQLDCVLLEKDRPQPTRLGMWLIPRAASMYSRDWLAYRDESCLQTPGYATVGYWRMTPLSGPLTPEINVLEPGSEMTTGFKSNKTLRKWEDTLKRVTIVEILQRQDVKGSRSQFDQEYLRIRLCPSPHIQLSSVSSILFNTINEMNHAYGNMFSERTTIEVTNESTFSMLFSSTWATQVLVEINVLNFTGEQIACLGMSLLHHTDMNDRTRRLSLSVLSSTAWKSLEHFGEEALLLSRKEEKDAARVEVWNSDDCWIVKIRLRPQYHLNSTGVGILIDAEKSEKLLTMRGSEELLEIEPSNSLDHLQTNGDLL